jgi:hypothetical protein
MGARIHPHKSKIESDPNLPLIERSLAMGVPMRELGRRYGYSVDTIQRHRARMPAQLKAAIIGAALKPKEGDLDRLRADEGEGLLGNLAHQRAKLLVCQDEAMADGNIRDAGYISSIVHRNLEMVGRYLGMFAQVHTSNSISVLLSQDYLQLRQSLVQALQPFPEARRAVAAALHQAEAEAARKIAADARPRNERLADVHPEALGRPQGAVIEHTPSPGTGNSAKAHQRSPHADSEGPGL